MAPAASVDCGTSRCSAVLSEVPASDPTSALSANSDRTPTVSSRLSPVCFATRPPWASAWPSWDTSAADLFAPAARTSATWEVSDPFRLNVFSAWAVIVAASPSANCPAAARSSEPDSAPPRMSAVESPAFASSASAVAASEAENAVSAPAWSAALRRFSRSAAVAFATAPTPEIALLNWVDSRTAATPSPAMASADAAAAALPMSRVSGAVLPLTSTHTVPAWAISSPPLREERVDLGSARSWGERTLPGRDVSGRRRPRGDHGCSPLIKGRQVHVEQFGI